MCGVFLTMVPCGVVACKNKRKDCDQDVSFGVVLFQIAESSQKPDLSSSTQRSSCHISKGTPGFIYHCQYKCNQIKALLKLILKAFVMSISKI